jgi:molybdate transport system substrate-binding protein
MWHRTKKDAFSCRIVLVNLFFVFFFSTTVHGAELTLALADSTCTAMQEVGAVFGRETGIELNYICKSSGLLVKGIRAGVIPADYFVSANKKWMDEVVKAGLIDPAAIQKGWKNKLVVASSITGEDTSSLRTLADLDTPAVEKIVIGDPGTAPFGRYAKDTLVNSKLWPRVKHKILSRKKISLAFRTLEDSGDVAMVGFLYKTNVKPPLQICFEVPQDFYPEIYYFSGPLIRSQQKKEMARFLSFLNGEKARTIFSDAGFGINY